MCQRYTEHTHSTKLMQRVLEVSVPEESAHKLYIQKYRKLSSPPTSFSRLDVVMRNDFLRIIIQHYNLKLATMNQ